MAPSKTTPAPACVATKINGDRCRKGTKDVTGRCSLHADEHKFPVHESAFPQVRGQPGVSRATTRSASPYPPTPYATLVPDSPELVSAYPHKDIKTARSQSPEPNRRVRFHSEPKHSADGETLTAHVSLKKMSLSIDTIEQRLKSHDLALQHQLIRIKDAEKLIDRQDRALQDYAVENQKLRLKVAALEQQAQKMDGFKEWVRQCFAILKKEIIKSG